MRFPVLAGLPQRARLLLQGPIPSVTVTPVPCTPEVGGAQVSLTLVAVGQKVGAGFQVLSVEAVNGNGGIFSHLSLKGTHSAAQN